MVNKCHAKRDTKTCSITYNPSLPGPYYYYWPGNPVIKPFGAAELLCGVAAGLCLAKPDAKRSHATRDRYLTGFPPAARMTG
ncbi:hypothetical protein [Candidatus Spongiihabitans sp.]|uniref:hypothetical protein n=1 Tax=Candidatus Spongiihabitans sp. TaxID=3101308 RepID=UPI003C7C26E6